MKSAARPRNDTTRLRALATGLRLMTTAAPKINVSKAKTQNRNGDIRFNFEFRFPIFERDRSFFLVPFQDDTVHDSADFEELFLVMHHVGARKTGDGVILAQENGLFGANFFAHSAKNAADH